MTPSLNYICPKTFHSLLPIYIYMYFVFFLSLLPISNAKGKTKIANSQSNVPHEILHSATMRNSLERFVPYYFIVFLFVTDERLTRCNSDELNISSIRPKIIREREKSIFISLCSISSVYWDPNEAFNSLTYTNISVFMTGFDSCTHFQFESHLRNRLNIECWYIRT